MTRFSSFALFTCLVVISAAGATDLPHGADALPYLERKATVIIEAGQLRQREIANARFKAYAVDSMRILRGEIRPAQEVRFFTPAALALDPNSSSKKSLLFLAVPTEKELAQIELERPFYRLISGHYGAIPIDSNDSVFTAVESYLQFEKTTEDEPKFDARLLRWAERYVGERNAFLQRSAVLSMLPLRNDDRAASFLDKAIKSEYLTLVNKTEAANILAYSQNDVAKSSLIKLAENQQAPESLRTCALRGVANSQDGPSWLKYWASSAGDDFLKSSAQHELRKQQ